MIQRGITVPAMQLASPWPKISSIAKNTTAKRSHSIKAKMRCPRRRLPSQSMRACAVFHPWCLEVLLCQFLFFFFLAPIKHQRLGQPTPPNTTANAPLNTNMPVRNPRSKWLLMDHWDRQTYGPLCANIHDALTVMMIIRLDAVGYTSDVCC